MCERAVDFALMFVRLEMDVSQWLTIVPVRDWGACQKTLGPCGAILERHDHLRFLGSFGKFRVAREIDLDPADAVGEGGGDRVGQLVGSVGVDG